MGKVITVRGYNIRSATVIPTGPAPRSAYMDQEAYDEIVATLGQTWADDKGLKVRKPKVAFSGKTIRAARAAGDGGTCPYVGLDYVTNGGVHHPADCGKEHDGKFAKTGNRPSAGVVGSGYEGHMAWAADVSAATIAAAKKAKKAS